MTRPFRMPALRIGSAASMMRDPLAPEVVNLSVRIEDRRAFRGVIAARETLIEKKIDCFIAKDAVDRGLIDETMNCAIDAAVAMTAPEPNRDKVRAQLELTAAMAIAALGALKGGGKC